MARGAYAQLFHINWYVQDEACDVFYLSDAGKSLQRRLKPTAT